MQRRSPNEGMGNQHPDLFGQVTYKSQFSQVVGVGGGSAERAPVRQGRGGYPVSCTAFSFSNFLQNSPRDPRLDDLVTACVPRPWRAVAAYIGVDKYLAIAALFATCSAKAASERRANIPSLLRLARHAAGPDQLDFFDAIYATGERGGEIKACGMPHLWLMTVKYLGVDTFLAMLGILSMDPNAVSEGRINAPSVLNLYHVARNAYIRAMLGLGSKVSEVRAAVQNVLGERLTAMRIYQIRAEMAQEGAFLR